MKLHNYIIPNKNNKFHPHALRSTGILVFLSLILLITPIYNMISVGRPQVLGYAINVNTNDVFSLSNQERINVGLAPLTFNSSLASAANAKANDMFTDNYWAHVAPDGATPWSFISASGYNYSIAGENLAKDFNTSSGVVAGWMGSQTHKDNVLNTSFAEVGYAVVNGTLLGSETTLVVAMYGAPAVIAQAPIVATTTEPTNNPTPTANSTPVQQTTQTEQPNDVKISTTNSTTETTIIVDSTKKEEQKLVSDKLNQTSKSTITKTSSSQVAGAFISAPIKIYNSFNWGQKVSLLLISTMALLFVMKHTMVWRQQKRGLRHIWLRAHPIGQAMVLFLSIIVILANGVGVIL